MPILITEETYTEAAESNQGWCAKCRDFTHDFCEPDAREYECPVCGQNSCFGAEQALIEMLITFKIMTTKSNTSNYDITEVKDQIIELSKFHGEVLLPEKSLAIKSKVLVLAHSVTEVKTEQQQQSCVRALQEIKSLIKGAKLSLDMVVAPAKDLTAKAKGIHSDFITEVEQDKLRLEGMLNHYQRKLLDDQRELERQEAKRQQEAQAEQERLQKLAKVAEKKGDDEKAIALQLEAEEAAINAAPSQEIVAAPTKARGQVVKVNFDFTITDWFMFYKAFPRFWKWDVILETVKLRRMDLKEALNQEPCIFTKNPDGLPMVAGLNVFESVKSHVR